MLNKTKYAAWCDAKRDESVFDRVENECVAVLNELSGHNIVKDHKGEKVMTAWEEYGIEMQQKGEQIGEERGLQRGEQRGEQKANIATAKRMISKNKYSFEEISEAADLPIDEVKKLAMVKS